VQVEDGDHGQDAPVVVGGLGQVELGADRANVLLDAALGDPEPPGDPKP
jgi:hypothetical protein